MKQKNELANTMNLVPHMSTFKNPFAAKRLVPGMMEYVAPDTADSDFVSAAAERFSELRVGQIVGPHGCGKTSLARAICDQLGGNYQTIRFVVVRNKHKIETVFEDFRTPSKKDALLVVDGIEQLSILHRSSLLSVAKLTGKKQSVCKNVLITSHREHFGWPLICELSPTLPHFIKLATRLCPNQLNEKDFSRAFDLSGGDYRQALMQLYDVAAVQIRKQNPNGKPCLKSCSS